MTATVHPIRPEATEPRGADRRIMWGWLKVLPEQMERLAPGATVDQERRVSQGVQWVPGTLAASYERVARHGGAYVLVSSMPLAGYREVMADIAAAQAAGE